MSHTKIRRQIICVIAKAKVKLLRRNIAATIREAGKLLNLRIGYIDVDPDIDNITGEFYITVPSFDIPISVLINENPPQCDLSDLFAVLDCIQSYFDIFDVVSGDIDAEKVDVFVASDVVTLSCVSLDGLEYEYWSRKSYEKGLPYVIGSFAVDLHVYSKM